MTKRITPEEHAAWQREVGLVKTQPLLPHLAEDHDLGDRAYDLTIVQALDLHEREHEGIDRSQRGGRR